MSILSLPDIDALKCKGLVMNSANFIRLFKFVCDLGEDFLNFENSYISGVSLSGNDLIFQGLGSAFNDSIDLSNLVFEEITVDDLESRINNDQLIPLKWYLLNNYKTVQYVAGSNKADLYEAPEEQIFVQAISNNEVSSRAISKDYAGEELIFEAVFNQYLNVLDGFSNVGVDNGDFTFNIIDTDTFSVGGSLIPILSEEDEITVITAESDEGGASWTGTLTNGDFTFDQGTQTFNLPPEAIDLNFPTLFLRVTVNIVLPQKTKGLIIGRKVPSAGIDIDVDFRGVKMRRFRSTAPDWIAGTYNEKDVVIHSNNIWTVITPSTSEIPSFGSRNWLNISSSNSYLYPQNLDINGRQIVVDSQDYQDIDMFPFIPDDLTTQYRDIIIKSLSNPSVPEYSEPTLNVVFTNNIDSSDGIKLSCVYLASATFRNIRNSKLYQVGTCNFNSTIINSNISEISNLSVRSTIAETNISKIQSSLLNSFTNVNINRIERTTLRATGSNIIGNSIFDTTSTPFNFRELYFRIIQDTFINSDNFSDSIINGDLLNSNFEESSNFIGNTLNGVYNNFTLNNGISIENSILQKGGNSLTISQDLIDVLLAERIISNVTKVGSTQVAAGAVAGEKWKTLGHATLPDNVILEGV